ncbi:MAG: CapA family protein, partial [Leptospiraceae bacterium]|nr:CapA family protein [Leptospiraceae bacterium]
MYSKSNLHNIFSTFILVFFLNCSTFFVTPPTPPVKILGTGDIMLHKPQLQTAYDPKCKCWKFDSVFTELAPSIKSSDLAIANLETTLPGDPEKYTGYPDFGAPDSILDSLNNIGINVITTTNNHSLDKGKSVFKRTIDILDEKQIPHTGTFKSENYYNKNRILVLNKNNIKISVLAYTYGLNNPDANLYGIKMNMIDKKLIAEDIKLAREVSEFIIVYFHFGREYEIFPDLKQRDLVKFTFNEGADVILGGHPHVIQPFEGYYMADKYGDVKKRLVFYSLGNFISAQTSVQ